MSAHSSWTAWLRRSRAEFSGTHDWQVGWLLALENASHIETKLVIALVDAGAVAHPAGGEDVLAERKNGWHAVPDRLCHYLHPARHQKRFRVYQQHVDLTIGQTYRDRVDVAIVRTSSRSTGRQRYFADISASAISEGEFAPFAIKAPNVGRSKRTRAGG